MIEEIYEMRRRLNQLIEGEADKNEILKLSEELDELIEKFMEMKLVAEKM